jgi:hypothetical protein
MEAEAREEYVSSCPMTRVPRHVTPEGLCSNRLSSHYGGAGTSEEVLVVERLNDRIGFA